mmetsp:Transcript_30172/g.59230  ORF Transcript_30172/g.59230 Transcript_30172/m.59230 type:complete len:87 (+) Transcript_30172:1667-1927(+)
MRVAKGAKKCSMKGLERETKFSLPVSLSFYFCMYLSIPSFEQNSFDVRSLNGSTHGGWWVGNGSGLFCLCLLAEGFRFGPRFHVRV